MSYVGSSTFPPTDALHSPTIHHARERKCCGVIEEVRERRDRERKPQPWIMMKMVIFLVALIMGYAAYAYVAQICVPMIIRTRPTLGSRAVGIILLFIFAILFLWMVWAYIKVVLTPPGFARDCTAQCERPLFPPRDDTRESIASQEQARAFQDDEGPQPDSTTPAAIHLRQFLSPSYEEQTRHDDEAVLHQSPTSTSPQAVSRTSPLGEEEEKQPSPRSASSSTAIGLSNRPSEQSARTTSQSSSAARRERDREKNVYRRPPSTPVLSPVLRYCDVDKIVKPYRAHHCRACGTCVLKYDHHCPWIGGCVGARNHKFFINFCFATSIFTAYVFGTTLPFMLKAMNTLSGVDGFDPRLIVLLALAAIFCLFTLLLCVNHVYLITHGQTTVESMNIRGMKERDDYMLARGFEWWEVSAKKEKKKAWDKEWGDLNTEGNIWWRGNAYEEWVDVMGKNWVGWIFPVGRGLSDGTFYPVNPRFDAEGRIRKRSEWPQELR